MKKYSADPILNEIANALYPWLGYDNYTKASISGKKLELLKNYLPKQTTTSPSNIMYRVILVKQAALKKLIQNNKPLVLKSREYSSWSYNLDATKMFAIDVEPENNEYKIILKRVFSSEAILVNVVNLLRYLESKEVRGAQSALYHFAYEKEIIIKNQQNNFKFTINDIFLFFNVDAYKWYKGSQLIKVFKK